MFFFFTSKVREVVKADHKRGGVSPLGPDCKQMWKFWSNFPIEIAHTKNRQNHYDCQTATTQIKYAQKEWTTWRWSWAKEESLDPLFQQQQSDRWGEKFPLIHCCGGNFESQLVRIKIATTRCTRYLALSMPTNFVMFRKPSMLYEIVRLRSASVATTRTTAESWSMLLIMLILVVTVGCPWR